MLAAVTDRKHAEKDLTTVQNKINNIQLSKEKTKKSISLLQVRLKKMENIAIDKAKRRGILSAWRKGREEAIRQSRLSFRALR